LHEPPTGSWQGRRRGLVFWRLAEFKGLSPGNGDGQEVRDTPERGVGGKMIDKIKGKYRLICDICGEAAEEVFGTFDEAVDYKVDSEWISRKQDGEWADICPNCYSIKGGRRQ